MLHRTEITAQAARGPAPLLPLPPIAQRLSQGTAPSLIRTFTPYGLLNGLQAHTHMNMTKSQRLTLSTAPSLVCNFYSLWPS